LVTYGQWRSFPIANKKKEKKKSPSVSHFCSHMVGGDNFWLLKEKKKTLE
jgi:hypothetical protein